MSAVVLTALDGSNPLAFLAAIGTLRLLSLENPQASVALSWRRRGVWLPNLHESTGNEDALSRMLDSAAKKYLPAEAVLQALGKNITVEQPQFAAFVRDAGKCAETADRSLADFATAFGSEVCKHERKERIEYTGLCFITGSGHQDFIGTMQGLKDKTTPAHIKDALFGEWKREKRLSMRWDPADAAEYAFRWTDPSLEGASSVWGANLLALHALPLFPSHPTKHGLRTTGFRERGRGQWPEFTWPIWTHALSMDSVRSIVSMQALQAADKDLDHESLKAFGIEEVYRSPRVRIGQGANFKVSFRPARAI